MADIIQVDSIILGAGIAGLSCADSLQQKGRTCVVIDPNQPGEGTSGSPGMLVNPATGRRAIKSWKAKECYGLITDLLERVQSETDQLFYEKNGVVRPALTEKLADNFERSPEKYDWPENWIEWVPIDEFSKRFPIFKQHFGGLFVKNAITVNGSVFLRAFGEYLAKRSVITKFDTDYQLRQDQEGWIAEIDDGSVYQSKVIIDATGYNQVNSSDWDFLNLHPVKGQTATFFFDEPLPLESSISSLGYMAFLGYQPNQLTVGSTYEHDFDHLETDQDGLEYLKKKLDKTLPGLVEKNNTVEQWSGVRVTVQDRKPVIGAHPKKEGLYIIGALGSKGLLMGRFLSELLVENILEGNQIDDLVSTKRFMH
ncbi:NAD(P)/FAD-dependent oxidoreductase [Rhodohalobacter sulfatireducens]|uniref:FAD-binding oxidoreductase n=1 Tax=Rhodohalobacter sulfatireducens TaxID=2911366 RepID=A0ABS9KGP6_9BACT|nr:FAD-binding oxidoreductase [Rhodohalobacter sulfatireducens]